MTNDNLDALSPKTAVPVDPEGEPQDWESGDEWDMYAPGRHLIRLRAGEKLNLSAKNPYLMDAVPLTDMLYTLPEIEASGAANIFPLPHQPVILEIGCYMGETVKEAAQRNPDLNILGVDIRYKRVVKSVRRIQKAKLENARIVVADARELMEALPNASLFGIIAFFPDPWRKLKHEKHRFLNDSFFKNASRRIASGGFVWIKTDSRDYLREAKRYAALHDFKETESLPRPLVGENHATFFETLFAQRLGQPIHQLILSRQ